MNPFFERNELTIEDLLKSYKANKSRTIFRDKGFLFVKDPYYETEVFWPSEEEFKSLSSVEKSKMIKHLASAVLDIEKLGGQMTTPTLEMHKGNIPVIVWGIFLTQSTQVDIKITDLLF